jgi:hypothetical protein
MAAMTSDDGHDLTAIPGDAMDPQDSEHLDPTATDPANPYLMPTEFGTWHEVRWIPGVAQHPNGQQVQMEIPIGVFTIRQGNTTLTLHVNQAACADLITRLEDLRKRQEDLTPRQKPTLMVPAGFGPNGSRILGPHGQPLT